jgi:molecular chaperone GrpE
MTIPPPVRDAEPSSPPPADSPAEPSADVAAGASDVDGIAVEVDAPAAGGAEARIRELEAALAAAEQGKKDNWDKYLRAVADVENGRKRAKRDLDDARAETRGRALKEMLPVVDNLERAIEHATGGGAAGGDAVMEGIKLVLRQFQQAFERLEVTPVDALGLVFDPNLHEAISQQESDEPPGTVVQVLQRGYRNGDRLLRPAMVVVARPRTKAAEAPSEATADATAEPKA